MYLFDFLKAVLHFEVNQSGRHSLNIKQYVAYYRVSTSRQTIGLQAQVPGSDAGIPDPRLHVNWFVTILQRASLPVELLI